MIEELLREVILFINIFIRKLEKLKSMLAAACTISHVGNNPSGSRY